jgi:hypothetical protein
MTVPRVLLVLGMMTMVGAAIVLLRSETAREAHRVQKMHRKAVALRHELWGLEMDLARLRAPDQIRRRAEELGLAVRAKAVETPEPRRSARPSGRAERKPR